MKPRRVASLGPAIIVASVVLGPGSILTSSRVGCDFGYGLGWVLLLAALLMVAMTALSARLGVLLDTTPGEAIAARAGRPVAALVGLVLFLVVACFQFSNNVAVIAALRPFAGAGDHWPAALLVALNGAVLMALFGLRRLYRPVETAMKLLVGVMLLGFLGNLLLARPAPGEALSGLLPSLPEGLTDGTLADPLLPVQAMIGTTFSVAGAFYQAYLVREKGWTKSDLRRGLTDSVAGITTLFLLTLMVMTTAAAVLHGRVRGDELGSAADVAVQLEPLFGSGAVVLFSVGLLAGALSSFLVNVMIGGTVMADGLGLGGRMDQTWPKAFTAAALLAGMVVALLSQNERPVQLIIFAQALTVLGNPVLCLALLWLSWRSPTPLWIRVLGWLGFLVVLWLAVRTGLRLYYTAS